MPLTSQQLSTLKAAILANPTWAAFPNSSDGNVDLAALLNQPAAPNFFVWKPSVPTDEIMFNGFDWTRVDNLTVGKARIWEWMTNLGKINPAQANVRAGVLAVFTAAQDLPNRQAVFDHCQRLASSFEKIFATGTGTTTTDQGVGPGLMGVEGPVTAGYVEAARNSA